MKYRKLGRTNIEVSEIGFGGIPIQRVSPTQSETLLKKALESGITYFDSARVYNDSEAKMGKVLSSKRDKIVISSKSYQRDKKHVLEDIEISCKRLQTDYLDLYFIHNPNEEEIKQSLSPDGALEGLLQAKEQGKIRAIGASVHRSNSIQDLLKTDKIDVFMLAFNPLENDHADLIEMLHKKNIGTVIMKPFSGGALPHPELSLRYILDRNISTVIPGMEKIRELEENIRASDLPPLNHEEEKMIIEATKKLGENLCRRCRYCMPCPQGLNIPLIFLAHGYYTRYNLKQWARQIVKNKELKFDCTECGECLKRCPYNLPIPEMIKEAKKHLT